MGGSFSSDPGNGRSKGNSFLCRGDPGSPREHVNRVDVSKRGRKGSKSSGGKSSDTGVYPKGTCDRCDGRHRTEDCTIFKKARDNHPDATRRKPPEMGKPGGNFVLQNARVVRQPGDGSCLFHSMTYGMGKGDARTLRSVQRPPLFIFPGEEGK